MDKLAKLIIWGCGKTTADIIDNHLLSDECNVIGFIDTYKTNSIFYGRPVYKPSEIISIDTWDYILVASNYSWEIKRQCQFENIPENKIIFLAHELTESLYLDINNAFHGKLNSNYEEQIDLLQEISPTLYQRQVMAKKLSFDLFPVSLFAHNKSDQKYTLEFKRDYVRYRTLELVTQLIQQNNIEGDIAELGVFRGDFAKYINLFFPERKLYLFDTFESFDRTEYEKEQKSGLIEGEEFFETFRNTSENEVLGKMRYPQNVIMRKGFFPETSKGLENNTFSFVSIDVDFEDSTLAGLEYFYPRLNENGYIFLHDYQWRSVNNAVVRYEKEHNFKFKKVPMVDACGSLVIIK